MFDRIIVAVDGSDASWRGVVVGDRLAVQCEAELELLHVEFLEAFTEGDTSSLTAGLDRLGLRSPDPTVTLVAVGTSVADTIAEHVAGVDGGVLVMSSTGHGRTEVFVGSIAEAVLAVARAPVVLVGPEVDIDRPDLRGQLVVPVDGSTYSESALDVAAAWSTELGELPWIVTVAQPGTASSVDVLESNYVHRLARRMTGVTHRPTEFEVLHEEPPARAIADFARSIDASLIVAATHGRTGLARLAHGSVAAGLVRHAPCPVVLLRPPDLPRERAGADAGAAVRSTEPAHTG